MPGVLYGYRQAVRRCELDGRRHVLGPRSADDHLRMVPHGKVEARQLLVEALLAGQQHRSLGTGGQGLDVVTLTVLLLRRCQRERS
ncbi:hypothetical protein ACFTZK_18500 [Streptomyces decoyicus]|uniref:hypothetical protein n=1 Tax=Streptomyces decoyicus TaxID=249567 RepID=UPI00363C2D47